MIGKVGSAVLPSYEAFEERVTTTARVGWARVVAPDQSMPVSQLEELVRAKAGSELLQRLDLLVKPSSALPCAVVLEKASNDKSTALIEVAKLLNVPPEDFIAFGDDLNDLKMLQWAGRSV